MSFDFRNIQAVLLDLDGTLIDSTEDLAASANDLRHKRGLPPLGLATVASYVGDGVESLVRRVLDEAEGDVKAEVDAFKLHYREHCLDKTYLYPGVGPTLRTLQARGLRLAVVTNKPERVSRRILDGLGVGDCFGALIGGDSCKNKKPHPEPLETALAQLGCTAARAVMVGDSRVDVEAGRNAGMAVLGILSGIGDQTLLRAAKPDLILERFSQLTEVL